MVPQMFGGHFCHVRDETELTEGLFVCQDEEQTQIPEQDFGAPRSEELWRC